MKKQLEDIEIIDFIEKGQRYKLNFSMLLATVLQRRLMTGNDKITIRIGAYKCEFKVLKENFDGEEG